MSGCNWFFPAIALVFIFAGTTANAAGSGHVRVHANRAWQKMKDFPVEEGEYLTITAQGTWTPDPNFYAWHDKSKKKNIIGEVVEVVDQKRVRLLTADGDTETKASEKSLLPGAPYGGLCYRIGDGPVHYVGKHGFIRCDRSGKLSFCINDALGESLADNHGALTVESHRK